MYPRASPRKSPNVRNSKERPRQKHVFRCTNGITQHLIRMSCSLSSAQSPASSSKGTHTCRNFGFHRHLSIPSLISVLCCPMLPRCQIPFGICPFFSEGQDLPQLFVSIFCSSQIFTVFRRSDICPSNLTNWELVPPKLMECLFFIPLFHDRAKEDASFPGKISSTDNVQRLVNLASAMNSTLQENDFKPKGDLAAMTAAPKST